MLRLLVLLSHSAAVPSPALAWWEYGHETVARIAWLERNPHTRAEIGRLLARSDLLETPTCPARTIAQASSGRTASRRSGTGSATPRPGTIRMSTSAGRSTSKRRAGTAIACRPRSSATPACSPTAACRCANGVMALAFLVHFVGDLHQPLHAGDRGDLGGNRLAVSYGIIAGRTNLHSDLGRLSRRARHLDAACGRGGPPRRI